MGGVNRDASTGGLHVWVRSGAGGSHCSRVAVRRERCGGVERVARGLAAVTVAQGGAEEWWVALTCVLAQPSELQRWAAWEAVAEVRGAGLEWAEVEARVRAAEGAARGDRRPAAVGSGDAGESAGASESAGRSVESESQHVWTGEEVAQAVERGGVVDLGGQEVVLTRAIKVGFEETVATVRNGTVRVEVAVLGDGYALCCRGKGRLRMEGVRVVGTGILCIDGGRVSLVDVEVVDSPESGVLCGKKGKVVMQGGRITGSKTAHGLNCSHSGQVDAQNVRIADCRMCGVIACRAGSTVALQGCRISGSQTGHGVACYLGGQVEVRDTDVTESCKSGVHSFGKSTKLLEKGGRITGAGNDGVRCEDGSRVEVQDVEIADCELSGVHCNGKGSKVVMQGGRILRSKEHVGVRCENGGQANVQGVAIADCKVSGVHCRGKGSKVVVRGGGILRCKENVGVWCGDGGQVDVRDMEIADCCVAGIGSAGKGSKVVVQGGRIAGTKDLHGVGRKDGGQAELRGVEIANCEACGVACFGPNTKVVVKGGRITGCKGDGVYCQGGGHATVLDVAIENCHYFGLRASDADSTLSHSRCTEIECGMGLQHNC